MTRWVALLRGVNVGGRTIRSADLATVFRGLGYEDVSTVLASGNVRFTTVGTGDRAALAQAIEAALAERFGDDAAIVLVTRDEVQRVADAFPFDATDPARQPWVIFCADAGVQREVLEAAGPLDPDVDPVAPGTEVLYWNPVTGTTVGTPFAKVLARRSFVRTTTNRNLRTLQKILA